MHRSKKSRNPGEAGPRWKLVEGVFAVGGLAGELSKAFGLGDAAALSDTHQSIWLHRGNALDCAAGPPDFEIYAGLGPKAEMKAEIVGGKEAGLAQDRLRLLFAAVSRDHRGTD